MRNAKKSALVLVFFAILALAAWLRIEAAMHTVVEVPIRADARDYVAYSYNMLHSSTYSRQVAWPVAKRRL